MLGKQDSFRRSRIESIGQIFEDNFKPDEIEAFGERPSAFNNDRGFFNMVSLEPPLKKEAIYPEFALELE
jgi:hypothetical protein